MSDDDLIRRGDAVKAVPSGWTGQPHQSNMDYGPNVAAKAIAAIRAIPATDAREAALREAAQLVDDLGQEVVAKIILALIDKPAPDARENAISEFEDDKYLIIKRGMYYRPNRQGYTSSPSEAGRYTLAQAVFLTHPNGPDGPRDGMSFVPLPVALIVEARDG